MPDTSRTSPVKIQTPRVIFSWAILLAWVGFIYATLGTVPRWRELLVERYGEGVFATMTYSAAGLAVALVLCVMILRNREKRIFPYVSLVVVLLFLRHIMRHWIIIPVEQIHFIEYGVVGFLAYNALKFHLKGWGLITAAILLTYFFGMVDECIQGILVTRVGEQRDMYWNALAGALALALVAFSLRPARIRGHSGHVELRSHVFIAILCLPIQGYFNATIAQFGVLIEDKALGVVFRSRQRPEALKTYHDHLSHFKSEIAPRLGKEGMNPLLRRAYDRIHEEALVHAFRGFAHFGYGNFPVAYKENLIIEKYFHQFVQGTDLDWPPSRIKDLQEKIGPLALSTYYSPVAEHLITKFTEAQMWVAIVLLESGLILLWLKLGRREISTHRKPSL